MYLESAKLLQQMEDWKKAGQCFELCHRENDAAVCYVNYYQSCFRKCKSAAMNRRRQLFDDAKQALNKAYQLVIKGKDETAMYNIMMEIQLELGSLFKSRKLMKQDQYYLFVSTVFHLLLHLSFL